MTEAAAPTRLSPAPGLRPLALGVSFQTAVFRAVPAVVHGIPHLFAFLSFVAASAWLALA